MGLYIGVQDLEDELGIEKLIALTDNDASGTVDEERAGKAIEYAEGLFDAYVGTRYTLPLPEIAVTSFVKSLNLDLAIYHLYKDRSDFPEGVYKVRWDAHKMALDFLKGVAAGKGTIIGGVIVVGDEPLLVNRRHSTQVLSTPHVLTRG